MNVAAAFNFELRVGQARALDAKIKALEEGHEKELAPFKALKKQLDDLILAALNQSGLQNVSGPAGGCHRKERVTYSLETPEDFKRHVIGTEAWDLLDWKANATATNDFITEYKALPPGVKRSVFITVGYTKPTAKATRVSVPKLAPPAKGDKWAEAEAMADTL